MIKKFAALTLLACFTLAMTSVQAMAQDQPPVKKMVATVTGSTVTVAWTPPRMWVNPDPAKQGYIVVAYLRNGPRVVQLAFPLTVQTCQFDLPPGRYVVEVYAHSAGYADSQPKWQRIIVN